MAGRNRTAKRWSGFRKRTPPYCLAGLLKSVDISSLTESRIDQTGTDHLGTEFSGFFAKKPLNSVPKWYYIREVTKMDFKYCKLEIFIPETHITQLQKALQSVDAGHIGKYDSCMSCSQLISYWRPLDRTDPYIGKAGEISCEREVKVEVTVYTEKVEETIRAIKEVHPYEEPVINALPIYRTSFL